MGTDFGLSGVRKMTNDSLWDVAFHVEYSDNDLWKHPIANSHFHKVYEIYYLLENELAYFINEATERCRVGAGRQHRQHYPLLLP